MNYTFSIGSSIKRHMCEDCILRVEKLKIFAQSHHPYTRLKHSKATLSVTSGKGLLSVGFVDVYVVIDAAPRGCGIGGTANVFGA